MKIATTTGDFSKFCPTDIERIRLLHEAGFRYIDLDMYFFTPDCPYMQDNWKEAVAELKEEANRLGMTFVQAHSQGGNAFKEDEAHVKFLIDATIRSIEICRELGIENTVAHPGGAAGITKEEWFERNKSFYQNFFPIMEETGVNVLIENSISRERYWTDSGKDMVEFLDYVGHPLLHACWDTGHGNLWGVQYDHIVTLGKHLRAIHYNDNHGLKDEHLIPYFGTVNHDEILNALIDIDYKGYFTLEATSSLVPKKCWLGNRKDFNRDTRLANPPLFMQQRLVGMLYDTAKYMLDAYGLFEE